MKISQFSVSRYRSIIEAEKISFGENTILIGKNNEGKSNILRAISTAIDAIRFYSVYGDARDVRQRRNLAASVRSSGFKYNWLADFPIQLQDTKGKNKKTRFRIDFELLDSEVSDFYKKFSLALNSQLPVVIEISSSGEVELSIAKPGKGNISFRKKAKEICEFIVETVDFVYVPAVRTGNDAMQMVTALLRSTLSELEQQPAYQNAVTEIQNVQKPALEKIASDIGIRLKRFIPSISSVSIDTSIRRLYSSLLRDIDLIIDDGVATHLDAKGDGIKSLVALSLFHSTPTAGKSRIIAIEEPESHLHHGAVHELKKVLRDLSRDGQVIISSHNPSFVDRESLSEVILVEGGRAAKLKNIEKLRQSLGVLVSDNLVNSEFSIVCEGPFDARAMKSILSSISPRLKSFIANGTVVFDDLSGANKLSYRIQTLNRDVFRYYVLLDNDDAARSAVKSALASAILQDADYSLLRFRGNQDAEIEDCLQTDALKPLIQSAYGLDITSASFGGTKKWSDRMKSGFEASGKIWTLELERALKEAACSLLDEKPLEKMREPAVQLFRTIAGVLESRLA